MRKRWLVMFALTCALLLVPNVTAQGHGQGQSKSKGKSDSSLSKDKGEKGKDHGDKDKDKSKAKGHDADDDKWEHRDGFESRSFGSNDGNPPGWSKGTKTGWKNCGVPPGQAKKGECRTYVHDGRRHYYYRDDQGRLIVRRPEIKVQTR